MLFALMRRQASGGLRERAESSSCWNPCAGEEGGHPRSLDETALGVTNEYGELDETLLPTVEVSLPRAIATNPLISKGSV